LSLLHSRMGAVKNGGSAMRKSSDLGSLRLSAEDTAEWQRRKLNRTRMYRVAISGAAAAWLGALVSVLLLGVAVAGSH
jgi:hypothetical protein